MKLKDLTITNLRQAESYYKDKLAELEQFRKTITANALSPALKEGMKNYEIVYRNHLDDVLEEISAKTSLQSAKRIHNEGMQNNR